MNHYLEAKEVLKIAENIARGNEGIPYKAKVMAQNQGIPYGNFQDALLATMQIAQTHAVLAIADNIRELSASVQLLRGSFDNVYDNVAKGDA